MGAVGRPGWATARWEGGAVGGLAGPRPSWAGGCFLFYFSLGFTFIYFPVLVLIYLKHLGIFRNCKTYTKINGAIFSTA